MLNLLEKIEQYNEDSKESEKLDQKIINDPVSFTENLLWIRSKKGKIIPFFLNSMQRKLEQLKKAAIDSGKKPFFLVLKSRRGGITTWEQAKSFWCSSMHQGQYCLTIAHDAESTQKIFDISQLFYEKIDPYWRAERKTHNKREFDFSQLGSKFYIGTAGSPDFGRGQTIQRCHGCLSGETKIFTPERKTVAISELNVGDVITTHKGNIAPITYKSINNKECISLTIKGLTNQPLVLTEEHKVYTKSGFKKTGELKQGDKLGFPVHEITDETKEINTYSEPLKRKQGGGRAMHSTPNKIALDYNFGMIIGFYLAEGYIHKQFKAPFMPCAVIFTIHRKETEFVLKMLEPVKDYISSISVRERKESLTNAITCYGGQFAKVIEGLAGRKDEKIVPLIWKTAGKEFARGLLHGYLLGDGHFAKDERRIRASSIRASLSYGMRDITASLGYGWGSVEYREGGYRAGRQEQAQTTLSFCGKAAERIASELGKESIKRQKTKGLPFETVISEGYAWPEIKLIKKVGMREVYDLEVGHEDHSYCTIHCATHNSEVSFWPEQPSDNPKESVTNLVAGLMEACSHGEIVFESTPNGRQGFFYHEWQRAKNGESEFTPIMLTWWMDDDNRLPLLSGEEIKDFSEEEAKLIAKHGLTPEQIKFRRSKKKALKALFAQEYPEDDITCFLFSGVCFFDIESLTESVCLCKDPIEIKENGQLKIWEMPQYGKHYVAGADVGEGLANGDYSSLGILDKESGRQVASLHGHWRPETFAVKIDAVCREYNNALLAVEANNHGHSVLNTLINVLCYPNLFKHESYDGTGEGKLGWQTTGKTRPILLDDLEAAITSRDLEINDAGFIEECLTFCDNGKGHYEAMSGCHDDKVMAWGIAWQARKTPAWKAEYMSSGNRATQKSAMSRF